jgi:putative transposase
MPSSAWPVHVDPDHLYFITASASQQAHHFQRDVIKRILLDSLNTGRILGQYQLYAFVIMPNHIHMIIRCLGEYSPGDVVREYKKATSNLIIRQLEAEGDRQTLEAFAKAVEHPQKQHYAVWENEYRAKNIFSPEFLSQKLDYIHQNPVQPHWSLVDHPEKYIWSSARFYLIDECPIIPLSEVRELLV